MENRIRKPTHPGELIREDLLPETGMSQAQLALVGGEIKTDKITGHIRSNIYVCEKFLDVKFLINEEKNQITVM